MLSPPQISNELVPVEAEWTQPNATELSGAPMACWRCTLAIKCVRPSHAGLYTLRVHSALPRAARASDDDDQSAAGDDATATAAPDAAETACLLAVLPSDLPHSSVAKQLAPANADAELRGENEPNGGGQVDAFLAGESPSQI